MSDETVRASLDALLAARESGIRYAETRLNSLALVSGGFIAAGIALLSIGLREPGDITRPTLIGAGVALLAVAMVLLLVYLRSTNPLYPFIDKQTALKRARWKWFYWDALPEASKFANLSWSGRLPSATRRCEVLEVDRQWPEFKDRLLARLNDDEENFEEDLRQLYTLHINERYKNAYLSRERSVLKWGLVFVIGATLVTGLVAKNVQSSTTTYRRANGQLASGVRYIERWSQESSTGGEVRLSLQITLQNPNPTAYVFNNLQARDQDGFTLPIRHGQFGVQLAARGRVSRTVSINAPRSYASEIVAFEVS